MLRLFDRIREVFTPELIESKQGVGNQSTEPVFIAAVGKYTG